VLNGLLKERAIGEDGLAVYECLNCDMAVYLQKQSGGSVWVNSSARTGEGVAGLSACFGLRVRPATGTQVGMFTETAKPTAAPETYQKIVALLAQHKARLEEQNEAKIKALRDELNASARRAIEEARREADTLWSKVVKREERDNVSRLSTSGGGATASVSPAPSVPTTTGTNVLLSSSSSDAAVPRAVRASTGTSSRGTARSPTLWQMDEDQSEDRSDPTSPGGGDWKTRSDKDSEDDALNVSASGLLPGSRRILFGSRESDKEMTPKSKVSMAHSVPVSIPMVFRSSRHFLPFSVTNFIFFTAKVPRWRSISGNGATSPGLPTVSCVSDVPCFNKL
jgi:hypothetical protein